MSISRIVAAVEELKASLNEEDITLGKLTLMGQESMKNIQVIGSGYLTLDEDDHQLNIAGVKLRYER